MELGSILESMGFTAGRYPETWQAVIDGIQFNICLHLWKGIAVSFFHVGGRAASHGEVFIPRSANQQEIAQTLARIHERTHGK
jgi:hypothetical protein